MDEINKTLYQLATKQALTTDDVAYITSALESKWYSVQVLAAKVLSKLNPPEARDLLKAWLKHHIKNRQMCFEAQKALLPCLDTDDVPWVFEHYLENRKEFTVFLVSALICYPHREVMERLYRDCYRQDNHDSVVVLARTVVVERDVMLAKLLQDPEIPHKGFIRKAFTWGALSKNDVLGFKRGKKL